MEIMAMFVIVIQHLNDLVGCIQENDRLALYDSCRALIAACFGNEEMIDQIARGERQSGTNNRYFNHKRHI
jgi:hypothetical protein